MPRDARRIRELYNLQRKEKQGKLETLYGELGKGDGTVSVPKKKGWVYARVRDVILQAYNERVPLVDGLRVILGYDPAYPTTLQVLSSLPTANVPFAGGITNHHETHEYFNVDGGGDTVWVELRQVMPLRVSPAGLLDVYVHRGVIWGVTTWILYESTATIPLASYVPADDANHYGRWVLISISNSGVISIKPGSLVANGQIACTLADLPAPDDDKYTLAGVRLYSTQTVIAENQTYTDIVDCRWPQPNRGASIYEPVTTNSGELVMTESGDVVYVKSTI